MIPEGNPILDLNLRKVVLDKQCPPSLLLALSDRPRFDFSGGCDVGSTSKVERANGGVHEVVPVLLVS